jgi:hypothetical protein
MTNKTISNGLATTEETTDTAAIGSYDFECGRTEAKAESEAEEDGTNKKNTSNNDMSVDDCDDDNDDADEATIGGYTIETFGSLPTTIMVRPSDFDDDDDDNNNNDYNDGDGTNTVDQEFLKEEFRRQLHQQIDEWIDRHAIANCSGVASPLSCTMDRDAMYAAAFRAFQRQQQQQQHVSRHMSPIQGGSSDDDAGNGTYVAPSAASGGKMKEAMTPKASSALAASSSTWPIKSAPTQSASVSKGQSPTLQTDSAKSRSSITGNVGASSCSTPTRSITCDVVDSSPGTFMTSSPQPCSATRSAKTSNTHKSPEPTVSTRPTDHGSTSVDVASSPTSSRSINLSKAMTSMQIITTTPSTVQMEEGLNDLRNEHQHFDKDDEFRDRNMYNYSHSEEEEDAGSKCFLSTSMMTTMSLKSKVICVALCLLLVLAVLGAAILLIKSAL